jgi:hypothetical protein
MNRGQLPRFTHGPWRIGKGGGAIVADIPIEGGVPGTNDVEAYGGYLVAETVARVNAPLLASAPRLLRALELMVAWHGKRGDVTGQDELLPPEYQTQEVREAMAAIRAATTYPTNQESQ